MPFTTKDVKKYNKKITGDKNLRKWANIANSVLKDCIEKGGTDKTCAGKAIKQANGALNKSSKK